MPCVTIAALQSPDRSISCLLTYISAIYLLSHNSAAASARLTQQNATHNLWQSRNHCAKFYSLHRKQLPALIQYMSVGPLLDSSFKITLKQEDTHSQKKNRESYICGYETGNPHHQSRRKKLFGLCLQDCASCKLWLPTVQLINSPNPWKSGSGEFSRILELLMLR